MPEWENDSKIHETIHTKNYLNYFITIQKLTSKQNLIDEDKNINCHLKYEIFRPNFLC
jgi:hypothetical protein